MKSCDVLQSHEARPFTPWPRSEVSQLSIFSRNFAHAFNGSNRHPGAGLLAKVTAAVRDRRVQRRRSISTSISAARSRSAVPNPSVKEL